MAGKISSDSSPAAVVLGHVSQQITREERGERNRICSLFKEQIWVN
jgi:hypothetical protein